MFSMILGGLFCMILGVKLTKTTIYKPNQTINQIQNKKKLEIICDNPNEVDTIILVKKKEMVE